MAGESLLSPLRGCGCAAKLHGLRRGLYSFAPPGLNSAVVLIGGIWLLFSVSAHAAPSQEDVFKSISENVSESPADWSKFLPFLLAAIGLVILLSLFSQRRKRVVTPKALNHPGKLMKEVTRNIPIRASELKQLKLLAEDAGTPTPVQSPLTLLLCPSVLARAIQHRQQRRAKIDRKAVVALARRVGLQAQTKR